MKIKHIDAYEYKHPKGLAYSSAKGKVELKNGTVFYYVTYDKPGHYIALLPEGPCLKISQKSFDKLSSRAYSFLEDVNKHIVLNESDDKRYAKYTVPYVINLLKHKAKILQFLKFGVKQKTTVNVKEIDTLKGFKEGQLGVEYVKQGITYKYLFTIGANPFFSFQAWVPRSIDINLDKDMKGKRFVSSAQADLFPKLKFKINPVNFRKSVVNLPVKKFDGTVYQWSTRI
jgi:hypothetical protein